MKDHKRKRQSAILEFVQSYLVQLYQKRPETTGTITHFTKQHPNPCHPGHHLGAVAARGRLVAAEYAVVVAA
ncbi:hypothetical protein Hanom_Chr05g00425141 [Helianthus anomalus]